MPLVQYNDQLVVCQSPTRSIIYFNFSKARSSAYTQLGIAIDSIYLFKRQLSWTQQLT